ncbi:hypothetical protein SMACR_09376 [Sordaria macrospora]|uniref:WGS project CABT00000000 data, contig 2.36 n=2 Tax=Sordaria macrospora TaxID=5147 RepID=F7W6T4_SORMK|nr:uncharacterized protein SMAC_09376 [Sordaria macrospora k-hell]KAA8632978.1 hypothetical protein SMACR_09376 [Sordaria macrospora]WPJ63897.1 hypothetical protein SMAC4_09376 [Sordaria macrospora]CCC13224.1 unnamed protein product [Sordaria macrospora k-hell]
MGSKKQPRQVSDPYEYIISWAKQISNEGGDEQSGEDGDNNRTCAGDEGELDVTSDSGDSVEEIVDIYLDMQRELKQAKAHNPYKQLDEWAKQFDDNQEESIVNQAERKEEEKNKYAPEPDSTEKRGRPDAVNWINNNDGNSGANTDEHIKNERKIGNDEKKGKQTRCTHSLVNHEAASVIEPVKAQPASTGGSFSNTSTTEVSNTHGKGKTEPRSSSPSDIDDDYFHVVRHPGMYALRIHTWNRRQPAVGDLTFVGPVPGTAVQPYVTNEFNGEGEDGSDWESYQTYLTDQFWSGSKGNEEGGRARGWPQLE